MPFTDLISVSSLNLDDVEEAISVQVSGHIRDSAVVSVTPHSQRDIGVTWQTRLKRAQVAFRSALSHPGRLVLVAKYIPENRIVGVLSSDPLHFSDLGWNEKGSASLLSSHTLCRTFSISEINPNAAYELEMGHKRAIKMSGIKGHFWHMAGVCTLSGFEGKGIAYKLIDTLFQRIARASGAPRQVFVSTNSASRRLYERYGFKVCSTCHVDLNTVYQTKTQKNAVDAGYVLTPKRHTEYYLTYDLTDVLDKASKAGRPVLSLRSGSEAPERLATLKQFNRMLRPVMSLSDLDSQVPARFKKDRDGRQKARKAPS